MKTLCKGKFKVVTFQAFNMFIYSKKVECVDFYYCQTNGLGLFYAMSSGGCKNRVFVNISAFTYSSVIAMANYQHISVFVHYIDESEWSELIKVCRINY